MSRGSLRSLLLSLLILSAVTSLAGADGPFFQGLGDLPGSEFNSQAFAVSADGSTVVGWSRGPEPGLPAPVSLRAFRWTSSSGVIEPIDVSGPLIFVIARDVSGDGSVVVGECHDEITGTDNVPCRWTAGGGMTALVDVTGTLTGLRAFGVSCDSSITDRRSKRGFRAG